MHKDQVAHALAKFFGDQYTHRITLTNPYKLNKTLALLETMDVLFLPPQGTSKQALDYALPACFTVGMSQIPVPEINQWVEFGYRYHPKTNLTAAERQQWAESLVRLALAIFLVEDVQPPFLLEELELLPFVGMNFILVEDWLPYDPVYLKDTDFPVRLLRLSPLYPAEAAAIQRMGLTQALDKMTIDFEDYERKPADI